MSDTNNNHDLFSAALESIETSKRVDKFLRFKNDFQRECTATLDNAQEWIKAELPIVTDYIDAPAVKDELKQPKTSTRRKHLLSALLFEKSLRDAIEKNNANTAALMAIHMFNHMWQAKVELLGTMPVTSQAASASSPNLSTSRSDTALETYNDTREKILTTLIEKGEKLKQDSQIQSKIKAESAAQNQSPAQISAQKPVQKTVEKPAHKPAGKPAPNKPSFTAQKKANLWSQEDNRGKELKRLANAKGKKPKKKTNSMFSKVRTKLPLKRKSIPNAAENKIVDKNPEDSLLDDPNRSSIQVNPGFSDSIDDSLIKARGEVFKDPNASGLTMHKILKERDHQKQDPGSNTIIMKLASSTGKRTSGKSSVPEQCQDAINLLTQQFPGYDMVAIRHMAAEKVGVSPQYIENLNILPENSA